MNFHAATEHAIRGVRACHDPDGEAIHAALQLAAHAWLLCDQPDTVAAHWDLFGTGLQTAIARLPHPEHPVTIHIGDRQLADTAAVRRDAARLVMTVAGRLDSAASDPGAHPDRRWAWATAAARLRAAASDLMELA